MHLTQTPSRPEISGERSPQSRHCPKLCTKLKVFSACFNLLFSRQFLEWTAPAESFSDEIGWQNHDETYQKNEVEDLKTNERVGSLGKLNVERFVPITWFPDLSTQVMSKFESWTNRY